MVAGAALLCTLLSGCAFSGTFAIGEHARAAIAQPQSCPGTNASPIAKELVLGTRTTVTEAREGKLGPDNVTTTTTTEPALAPVAAQEPLHEATGAAISETGGGVLRTVFGFLGGFARGVFALFAL